MRTYFKKWHGTGSAAPPRAPLAHILLAGLGGLLAIGIVSALAHWSQVPWILGSFGATCVLVFGFPDAPFSQPRAVIGGHVVASTIGVLTVYTLGTEWWCVAVATSAAIMAMMALRIVHPPAGSNPVIAVVSAAHWEFIALPTLCGAVAIVVCALVYLNLVRKAPYPQRW